MVAKFKFVALGIVSVRHRIPFLSFQVFVIEAFSLGVVSKGVLPRGVVSLGVVTFCLCTN